MLSKRAVSRALPWAIALLALCMAALISAGGRSTGLARAAAPGAAAEMPLRLRGPELLAQDVPSTSVTVCLPIVLSGWALSPQAPALDPIANADADSYYTVTWAWPQDADSVVLEEAQDPSFSSVRVVFQGNGTSWTVPAPGKIPGTYYYRLKARNEFGDGAWSAPQPVTIYPMFVGLQLRWDGEGYVRGDLSYDFGLHLTRDFTGLTAADTILAHSRQWYDPNPVGLPETVWDSTYSLSTGNLLSNSVPPDPAFKWTYPALLPYDVEFTNGQPALIDGQVFNVSGPFAGLTAFGSPVHYWQLINSAEFLYWDGGDGWTQRIYPGDAVLWYDAGPTRLMIMDDITRHTYYQEAPQNVTLQTVDRLTYANSFPGARRAVEGKMDSGLTLGVPRLQPGPAEVGTGLPR